MNIKARLKDSSGSLKAWRNGADSVHMPHFPTFKSKGPLAVGASVLMLTAGLPLSHALATTASSGASITSTGATATTVAVTSHHSAWWSRRHRTPAPTTTTPAPTTAAPTTVRPTTTVAPTTAPATTAPPALDLSSFIVGGGAIPPSSAADPTGNFRVICEASHLAYDDPIVKPGQPGASHLHLFFGNTTTDAYSTYASLRANGNGSCQGGPLNRSAYWAPAVLTPAGQAVMPDFISVYYKGNGPTAANIATIRPMPAGLKMVAGASMTDPTAVAAFYWACENGTGQGSTIPSCPSGMRVGAVVDFPSCWDGVNLDSADHRSHMAYLTYAGGGGAHCPADHPVMLPQYTVGIWYMQSGDSATWKLSSDMAGMPGMAGNGSSMHADWFGAWDPTVQATWTRECINALRNCIAGQLGDGTTLAGNWARYTGPKLVTPPTH